MFIYDSECIIAVTKEINMASWKFEFCLNLNKQKIGTNSNIISLNITILI